MNIEKSKNNMSVRVLAIILSFCMFLLSGCSSSPKSSSISLQEGVTFSLQDVLEIDNEVSNTIYYYFLAAVDNESDKTYHISNLEYHITDRGDAKISVIDRYQSTITRDINPGTSSFVYGYIGFPNSNEREVGLDFPRSNEFLAFDSVKVRVINDDNIVNSTDETFTVYEDEYFSLEVNSSKLTYSFDKGKSIISGLNLTYTNKTDSRLVIPYLTPICTINGISLNDYKNSDELKSMTLLELKKQNFSVNNLPPKTTAKVGQAYGYQLYYLTSNQRYTCEITFEFDNFIPDFNTGNEKAITININSPALGYSQLIHVDY